MPRRCDHKGRRTGLGPMNHHFRKHLRQFLHLLLITCSTAKTQILKRHTALFCSVGYLAVTAVVAVHVLDPFLGYL